MPDGTINHIYIGRKYGENNREISPTVCKVISVGDEVDEVSVGDDLILHHNIILNEASYIKKEGQEVTIGIPANDMVYAKINPDGTLTPLFNTLLAERIVKGRVSEFEYEDKTEQTKFKVISVASKIDDVKEGDTILAYKLSDYEMVYHYNNKECRAIRILYDDVLGVFN